MFGFWDSKAGLALAYVLVGTFVVTFLGGVITLAWLVATR